MASRMIAAALFAGVAAFVFVGAFQPHSRATSSYVSGPYCHGEPFKLALWGMRDE